MLRRRRGLVIILRVPAPFLLVAALLWVAAQARPITSESEGGFGMLLGKAPPRASQVADPEHQVAELHRKGERLC